MGDAERPQEALVIDLKSSKNTSQGESIKGESLNEVVDSSGEHFVLSRLFQWRCDNSIKPTDERRIFTRCT
jgi:hypothetical protein